jgi:hypothetical protein
MVHPLLAEEVIRYQKTKVGAALSAHPRFSLVFDAQNA